MSVNTNYSGNIPNVTITTESSWRRECVAGAKVALMAIGMFGAILGGGAALVAAVVYGSPMLVLPLIILAAAAL